MLTPKKTTMINGVKVNEYFLENMYPSGGMDKLCGVTIHNTDWITVASGTTPAEQYTRATLNGNMGDVLVHYYVDDTCAWQNLPHNVHGWHAADGRGQGNMQTIAIECIMSSNYNDRDKKSEDNAARLCAALLKQYGFTIDHLYPHQHWYSKKYCPAYILPHWNAFVNKVKSYMNSSTPVIPTPDKLYRVRKSWSDVASQIGAYKSLDSAKAICKEGYFVFDDEGNVVYPIVVETCKVELPVLKKGDKGNPVETVQYLLKDYGYNIGTAGVDGSFGSSTETAVKAFQKKHSLEQTGKVDEQTWNILLN